MIRTGLLGKAARRSWAPAADGLPMSARAAMATTDANFPAADRPMPCAPWRILADFKARRSASKPRRPQEKRGMAPLISRHNRLGARDDFGWRLVEPFDQRLYVDADTNPSSRSILAPSAISCGSRIASANASRNAVPKRGSRPGGATRGRPIACREKIMSSTKRSCGLVTNSSSIGTSGSSLCFCRPSCMTILSSAGRKIIPVASASYAPGIADDAVELAALDREHDFLRAGIAGDRLEPSAKERIERDGKGVLVAASAG